MKKRKLDLCYTPSSNGGGVNTSDIETIGGFGGMNVVPLDGGSGGVPIGSSTGQVVDHIMITE